MTKIMPHHVTSCSRQKPSMMMGVIIIIIFGSELIRQKMMMTMTNFVIFLFNDDSNDVKHYFIYANGFANGWKWLLIMPSLAVQDVASSMTWVKSFRVNNLGYTTNERTTTNFCKKLSNFFFFLGLIIFYGLIIITYVFFKD